MSIIINSSYNDYYANYISKKKFLSAFLQPSFKKFWSYQNFQVFWVCQFKVHVGDFGRAWASWARLRSSPMLYYFVFTNFWVGDSYSAWILQAHCWKSILWFRSMPQKKSSATGHWAWMPLNFIVLGQTLVRRMHNVIDINY